MKKALLIAVALLTLSTSSFSATGTSDGVITLNFYEDTQQDIDNLWVLDFTMNDINPYILGGWFAIRFGNNKINFENEYNALSPYFSVSKYFPTAYFEDYVQDISSVGKPMIPVGTSFSIYGIPNELFYQTEEVELRPIIGTIDIILNGESMQLTGPIYFAESVPEPISMGLFVFGAIFIKSFIKKHL